MAIDRSKFRLKNTIKYPTSLLVNGASAIGLEIAESLLEQGGYVIIVDAYTSENVRRISAKLGDNALISLLDYSSLLHLEEDLRRLDYIFYLAHEGYGISEERISTQSFLKYSNYLDATLGLAVKFEAKFLLTTSIRAHQQLMASMDLDINYGAQAAAKHSVYTDMEVQRYAESLTLEYVKKADLNARILRLGELIGSGIDFSVTTPFIELLTSAVAGRDLELRNDGLDSDWYVHILDAAYGVIKAQFTKSTKGEIYSLAFENSITHLSIAYKLQELEPEAAEIVFSDRSGGLPPLRLYKPAPNLEKVGWRPRVNFDEAVKESLTEAKLYILNSGSDIVTGGGEDSEDNLVGKIRSFITLAHNAPEEGGEVTDSGPVSRLIAERKRQERLREAALERADSNIKVKKKSRDLTQWERIKGWFWRTFLDTRTNFPFLRNITPLEFLFSVLMIVLGIWFYFGVFAPVMVIARDTIVISQNMNTIETDLEQLNLNAAAGKLEAMHGSLSEIREVLSRYEGIAHTLALGDHLGATQNTLLIYSDALDALKNIVYAAEPFAEYLDNYTDNVTFRPNTDSYLSTGVSTDYSSLLSKLEQRSAFAKAGKEKLDRSVVELQKIDVEFLPGIVRGPLAELNFQLQELSELGYLSNISNYVSELLGSKTYLFLLLDNSRPMPIGGELSSYLLLSVRNGSIAEAKLQPIDTFAPSLSGIPAYALEEINLTSFETKTPENLTLRDLAYLYDPQTLQDVVGELWATTQGRLIDGVVLLNYSALMELLDVIGEVELEGIPVTADNFLIQLNDLQGVSQTAVRRNDLVSQVFARVFDTLLSDLPGNFLGLTDALTVSAQNKSVVMPPAQLKFSELVVKEGLNTDLINNTDFAVRVMVNSDPQVISPTRLPALNQITKVTVNDDSSLSYQLTVKFPAIENIDEIALCLPLSAADVEVIGVASQRVKTNKSSDMSCAVANIVAEREVSYSWRTIRFESNSVSEYNLRLGQVKVPGTEVTSDLELNLAPSLTFLNITPEVDRLTDRVVFTESIKLDQIIDLKITKQ